MKSRPASEPVECEAARAPKTAELSRTTELPAVAGDDEEADAFAEIPTVANRANPTTAGAAGDAADSAAPPEGAGAYRIMRPTNSDVIDPPAPAHADPSAGRRVVIGASRKTR